MRAPPRTSLLSIAALGAAFLAAPSLGSLEAQQAPQGQQATPAAATAVRLVAEPSSITVRAGQEVPLKITAYDAQGREIPDAEIRVAAPRSAVWYSDGMLRGRTAGQYNAVATISDRRDGSALTLNIPVTVSWLPVTKVDITADPGRLYTGVMLAHRAKGLHADGSARPLTTPRWTSSNASIASVDRHGNVTAHRPGAVTISAEIEGVTSSKTYTVVANPVTSIEITTKETQVRTGDVVHLTAVAKRANGQAVADMPVTWSYTYTPDDTIAAAGGAGIVDHGMFAANAPGRFTILATAGNSVARHVIQASPRDVVQRITVTGRGNINTTHTSDLWPWTGKDGKDYVIVGTWGGDGYAIIFDITDLANPIRTDSIQVDARTINDVTVSPDGRYAVMSREGASNRVNGLVILDLANPRHPKVAAQFNEQLTGGVHNLFATNDYLFAVSGGQKYVIIDVRDIYNPKYVSEYRHPNARIHDLWVHDGIAYSAQGGVGAVIVDVGNGKYGGTIEKPKLVTTFPVNSGHEIYPYFQKATGKVYLFLGDEVMNRQGKVWEGTNYRATMYQPGGVAQTSGGYTHIVDITDPFNAREVAKYHLEDYGSHDIIVEDDILYQAYYDGGLRLVDVSGELLGNLAEQRREIAVFKPYDPEGFTANAPFVMNAMPWKGHVLFTDFNSGLWSAKLEPKQQVP